MFKIGKVFELSCSHRLINNNLSDEENIEKFGKCFNEPSHGHNYIVEIILEKKETQNGMIVNFSEIGIIFKEIIEEKFDHKFLNDIMNEIPTVENMAKQIFIDLKYHLPRLKTVKVWETRDNYAEYTE